MVRFARRALVVVPALLAGCKDDAIVALESTRNKVCECADAACVNAAMDALVDRPTKQQRKAEALAREIMECTRRVYEHTDAEPPPPDAAEAEAEPDAAPPADPAVDALTPP